MALEKMVTLTFEGKRDLEEELEHLKSVRRPEIAQKISRAAADGDLSENGAYHNAKEEQGWLEGRILQLENILRNARVAEDTGDVVGIGKKVTVTDEAGKERTYRIVSSHEVDPQAGNISDVSPIGAALMGHRVGDVVEANTPGRTRTFTITALS
jgi:transcription elongation factor GreA